MLHSKNYHLEEEEAESDENWAISYGDMITLLLCFFVIFYSTDFKKNKEDKIDEHFMTNFKMLDLKNDKIYPPTADVLTAKDKIVDVPKFELLKNAKISKLNDRLLITFDNMNFFNTGEIDPNAEAVTTLKEFAAKFLPYSSLYKINVKAFTDKRSPKGNRRYKDNLELAALRAVAALRILQKAGIPLNKLEIAGYGEMDKLNSLISPDKIKNLTNDQIQDMSRTLIIIIKHDNEQSLI